MRKLLAPTLLASLAATFLVAGTASANQCRHHQHRQATRVVCPPQQPMVGIQVHVGRPVSLYPQPRVIQPQYFGNACPPVPVYHVPVRRVSKPARAWRQQRCR